MLRKNQSLKLGHAEKLHFRTPKSQPPDATLKIEIRFLIFNLLMPLFITSNETFNQLFPDHLFINGDIRECLLPLFQLIVAINFDGFDWQIIQIHSSLTKICLVWL